MIESIVPTAQAVRSEVDDHRMGCRFIAATLAGLAVTLAAASGATAAELRPVGNLRVAAVGKASIELRWMDRSRGEASYRIEARSSAGRQRRRARRNATRGTLTGLDRGVAYGVRVRACGRARCSPWGKRVRAATLLAPVNGPHPDPECAAFPAGDAFNRVVSGDEVAASSDAIIDRINADGGDFIHPDFGSNPRYGIPYMVVPAEQPLVPIRFGAYGGESDPGPYPIPPGTPVEGGRGADGDRHALVIRRPTTPGGGCDLFELYRAFESRNARNTWRADSAAIFDLGEPLAGQRPAGWTSADAAGLPIYPGLVTYEEVRSGVIDHAIRVTFERTRRGYFAPATHYASDSCNPSRPSMGLRLRLRDDYDVAALTGDARVIATALRTYGMIVADNGSNWYVSGSTDRRWDDDDLGQLKDIPGDAFEVVEPSGTETTPC